MDELNQIIANIKKGDVAPIYFLMGDEPYFIDILSDYIANNVLSEEEKGFNQMVLYGRDVSVSDIINNAKRYPMMAPYQVIIIKEAQALGNSIEELTAYVENPQPTTLLVICYKYKSLDKRKKLSKAIPKNNGILFDSKPLRDYQIVTWIQKYVSSEKYSIEPKAAQMLSEFIGNDLSRISNELQKLFQILPQGSTITPDAIEKNIGFSKDFNIFELQKAIGEKNDTKVAHIIHNFAENPKEHNIIQALTMLYSFFQKILLFHGLTDQSDKNVGATLKIPAFFAKDYRIAAQNYPMKRVSQIIAHLRMMDAKSKGVESGSMSPTELYKELFLGIMR